MAIQELFDTLQERVMQQSIYHQLITGAFLLPVLYVIINEFVRSKARIGRLNGPKGLPLIGNLHQIRVNAAEQYRLWSKRYGDVYQIQLGNIPVVVVNTAEAAKVIFGNNSQALASRPEFYTFHKVSSVVVKLSHRLKLIPESNARFCPIQPVLLLVHHHIAIRSSAAERVPHPHSTGHQYRPMFPTWISNQKTSLKSYTTTEKVAASELTPCP